jgi:glycosyltransferase involved in cell wall biosynthesis
MSRHKLHLLHILPRFYPGGGIDTFVALSCKYLDPEVFDIDIICHEMKQPDFANLVTSRGGTVTVLEPFGLRSLTALSREFVEYLDSHPAYDIVHCHMANAGFMYLKHAQLAGVPVRILHSHQDHYADTWSHAVRNIPLIAAARRHATDFCAASHQAGDFLFRGKPYTVLRNGVDTSVFHYDAEARGRIRRELGIPSSAYILGFVGRLTAQKNPEFAIRVMADAMSKIPDSGAIVLGDGGKRPEIQALTESLGIADRVNIVGEVSNPADYYAAMDMLLMPSLYEGLPFTLVEAQACGLPALVSDTVSREACLSSRVVYLPLSAGDQSWCKALPARLTDKQRESGTEIVERARFDQQSSIDALTLYYENVIRLRRDESRKHAD